MSGVIKGRGDEGQRGKERWRTEGGGGQGRVHCLLHKTRQRPRTSFRLKCPFQGFPSDWNLANSRQILPKLMGTSSVWVAIKSFRLDDGRGRGRTKNDLQKSAICHCDP